MASSSPDFDSDFVDSDDGLPQETSDGDIPSSVGLSDSLTDSDEEDVSVDEYFVEAFLNDERDARGADEDPIHDILYPPPIALTSDHSEASSENSHSASEASSTSSEDFDSDTDSLFVDQQPSYDEEHRNFAQRIEQNTRQLRELQEQIRRTSAVFNREIRRHEPLPPPFAAIGAVRNQDPHPRGPNNWQLLDGDGDDDLFNDSDDDEIVDELVAMEFERSRPQPPRSRRHRSQNHDPAEGARPPPAVIDLTEEPDTSDYAEDDDDEVVATNNRRAPGAANAAASHNPASLNRLRRLFRGTPSLARSDGSILGGAAVIDLTVMDDDPAPPRANPRGRAASIHERAARNQARARSRAPAIIDLENENEVNNHAPQDPIRPALDFRSWPLPDLNLGFFHRLNNFMGRGELDIQFLGAAEMNPFLGANPNPLAENLPNFNYQGNGYNNGPQKPVYVPPPAPAEGFGRNTGEDLVFVCPSCERELKYDPDEAEPKTPPAKRPRNRKACEEHHFWAVKECGHVSFI